MAIAQGDQVVFDFPGGVRLSATDPQIGICSAAPGGGTIAVAWDNGAESATFPVDGLLALTDPSDAAEVRAYIMQYVKVKGAAQEIQGVISAAFLATDDGGGQEAFIVMELYTRRNMPSGRYFIAKLNSGGTAILPVLQSFFQLQPASAAV
jgi:hypothetical protein